MKILEERYPLGSLPYQKTAGRYCDKFLFENVKILAKNIIRDMTFLIIVSSSTLEVGTGKSVFIQQMAETFLENVRELHGIDNKLDLKNIVFSPKELIKRAFEIPKHSVILLDEWEDTNYWSQLGMTLRQFFRKCRQLNLLMICIIPNFFQMPMNYAVSRSVAFIDVQFRGEFERGFFRFFSFNKKRELYLRGKKTQNYNCVKPDFIGRFADGYVIPETQYRHAKYLDMIKFGKEDANFLTEKQVKQKLFKKFHQNSSTISIKDLAEGFGIALRTAYRWLKEKEDLPMSYDNYNSYLNKNDDLSKDLSEGLDCKNKENKICEH